MILPPPTSLTAAIFGIDSLILSPGEAAFFRQVQPFGFILFARNVDTPDQLSRLTGDLRAAVGWDAPIFVDQEGGRVQRLRAPHWTEWLPPSDAVALAITRGGLAGAERMMYLRHRLIAAELRAVGIDGNCAPCLDVATDVTHPFLRNRCFGTDATTVACLGRAAAFGLLAGGVLPVMKHLPGHGRASADTHHDLPTVTVDVATLAHTDFAPFQMLADMPLAMTAHIVFSAISPRPATSSAPVIDVIRRQIGFDGVLMSDDLNMQALKGSPAMRTRRAIRAGCDIALFCKGSLRQMQAVATAAGHLTPDAARRAALAVAARKKPDAVDIEALHAEHSALLYG